MDGFVNVMQWHDWWWLWAHEHCLAGYGFSHKLPYIVAKPLVTGKTVWCQSTIENQAHVCLQSHCSCTSYRVKYGQRQQCSEMFRLSW